MNHINLVALVSRLQQVLPPPTVTPQVSLRTLLADVKDARDFSNGFHSGSGSPDVIDVAGFKDGDSNQPSTAADSYPHDGRQPQSALVLPSVSPYELDALLELYDELVLQLCRLWLDIEEYSYNLLLQGGESPSVADTDPASVAALQAPLPWALPTTSSATNAISRRHPKSKRLGTFEEFLAPPPPPPEWGEAYRRATIDKLPEAECQALANMLFAAVRCGLALDAEWTERWLGVVGPRLADFRVEELTQMMWAFSECAASQRRLQQRLLHTPDRDSTPAERRTGSSLKQPLHSADSVTEPDLVSPDASAVVADISLPSDAWVQALCDSLEGRLNELQPQNHAIILTGCMSLDFVPQPDWISSCLRHATTPPLPPGPRVLDMRPRNLLAILSAVAAWQHTPEEDVAERFGVLLRQLRPVMTDEDGSSGSSYSLPLPSPRAPSILQHHPSSSSPRWTLPFTATGACRGYKSNKRSMKPLNTRASWLAVEPFMPELSDSIRLHRSRYQRAPIVDTCIPPVPEVPKPDLFSVVGSITAPYNLRPEKVFAVVELGGTQFKVTTDDVIFVNQLPGMDVNDVISLDRVLLLGSRTQTVIGRPFVPNSCVLMAVEEHFRDGKVHVFKKKAKKRYRRYYGPRPNLTTLRVLQIHGIDPAPGDELVVVDPLPIAFRESSSRAALGEGSRSPTETAAGAVGAPGVLQQLGQQVAGWMGGLIPGGKPSTAA
ncbi:MAG: hypothetical protein WDW38_001134 [Sanguina aurantia]